METLVLRVKRTKGPLLSPVFENKLRITGFDNIPEFRGVQDFPELRDGEGHLPGVFIVIVLQKKGRPNIYVKIEMKKRHSSTK